MKGPIARRRTSSVCAQMIATVLKSSVRRCGHCEGGVRREGTGTARRNRPQRRTPSLSAECVIQRPGRESLCADAVRIMLAKEEIVFSASTFAVADSNSAAPGSGDIGPIIDRRDLVCPHKQSVTAR